MAVEHTVTRTWIGALGALMLLFSALPADAGRPTAGPGEEGGPGKADPKGDPKAWGVNGGNPASQGQGNGWGNGNRGTVEDDIGFTPPVFDPTTWVSGNRAVIDQRGVALEAEISQRGNMNWAEAIQSGDSNLVRQTQVGNNNTAIAIQDGSGNQLIQTQTGNGFYSRITQSGNGMVTVVNQY